jgi:pyruvate,water dikinase
LEGGFDRLVAPCAALPRNENGFRHLIHGVYRTTESNYFRTIFCASLAKLDFMDAYPQADYPALVSGLPNLAHLEPVAFLRTADGAADVDELMRRFPHRSRRELDIRVPRWAEDREWVELLCRDRDTWGPRVAGQPRAAFERARAHALERLRPWQRRRFTRKLDRLRAFIWLREQMRDLSTRVYHLLRRCVLTIAEERGLGDDIFFMSWQEILADDPSGVAAGRATYEGYRHFQAPNEIGARHPYQPRAGTGAWRGLAASPGRVTGRAQVARTV